MRCDAVVTGEDDQPDAVERREVVELFPRLADACETWLRDGVVAAMNKHNGQAQGKP